MEYSISCISQCCEFKIASQRDKAPQEVSWLRADNHLVRAEEPSTLPDLPDSVPSSSSSSHFEIEYSSVQADLSVLASTSSDKMAEPSIPVSEIEKMIEKIVAASLEKLLRTDKGKEQVVIEDDEAKGESERKEHIDDTWQDEEFFKKMSAKKAESELVVSEEFENLDKKLKKLHVFVKSKGMDQYVDINDDDDEELELKQTTPMTYTMCTSCNTSQSCWVCYRGKF
ncbi:hypothetical protein JCGZ_13837 [Jatropha curcas]|uniref:Uncharacterized protein n=1 Tax=Jatropha curcas TaxID=180498 RepID=A0A067KJ16_JATCU|nr:hypothetical protein JCGZ_13837 [Jatropha curcas]